ncbi:exonuclease VII large subunit [Chryseobacterium bernardetii]|uniref:Exonuclease VII large subunit n=1 Tax=Chryseobacterium bernardetii TaxID=1241978 RepID=A0ACC6IXU8_9FLAO|nr:MULTISPECIES: exodeoxyribonuclease VII large subunit [Chryseobacterium]MDR6372141.1 exonuclease VII large subunit [Chryseobacterium vietnamense]MDR6442476.1 exonuclease VII large subunit [Chryseobacterium bernardetii]
MIMLNIDSTNPTYSPSSILGLFSNALKINATVNLIYLKGRYAYGGGKSYGNYYYDNLFSESDNISIGVRISALLRTKIVNSEVYTLRGYIEKSIKNSSVELRFVVDEIIQQEEKAISEEELQRYELIQAKLEKGSTDPETVIRNKILKEEPIRIANIYGNNAIVQRDFAEGLDVSQKYFQISEYTCSITSSTSIAEKLKEVSKSEYDIIALVRGGGDRQSMETFNDITLSKLFINLPAVSVTAIGHTVDETLLDKLADKRFHLPHDYGAGLHAIVEKLLHEKSNSRALLIDEVKKDVSKQFTEQVKTLSEQLAKKTEEFQKLQELSSKQLLDTQKNFTEQQKQRQLEMDNYKKEISVLYEKNLQSVINEKTASLKAGMESLQKENSRLTTEVQQSKGDYSKVIIAVIISLIVGFVLATLFK